MVPDSTYLGGRVPFFVEAVFDLTMAVPILIFRVHPGRVPKPPDFSKLAARSSLSFFASHLQFTLFLITLIAILILVGFAVLSRRVKAFWARVKQGVTICSTAAATSARCGSSSSPAGAFASPRSGSC